MYLKFQHDKHETGCAQVLLNALEMSYNSPICVDNFKKFFRGYAPDPQPDGYPLPPTKVVFPLLFIYEMIQAS
jgi:hypothetical protein